MYKFVRKIKMKKIDISVVVPVYNASLNLKILVDEISEVLKSNFDNYELILIDDNSLDNSWHKILELCKSNTWIKGIELRKNVGQHNAILAGLKFAEGNNIITMDDDCQNSPKYIVDLSNEVNKGFDVCYATYLIKKHNILRILASKINNLFVTLLFNKPLGLHLTSFRCISHDIKEEIIKNKSPSVYLDGLILSITQNISKISVTHNKRKSGTSNYTFFKLLSLWMQMATGFSIAPLRLASILGIVFSITGFIMSLWLVFFKSPSTDIPMGWTSLIVVILFLGGIQLLALGVIGEYLGRTYLAANNYPQFSIRKTINTESMNK